MNKAWKIVIAVFVVGWLIKEILIPVGAAIIYSDDFMEYVYECDTAMEGSWYYRQNDLVDKRSETTQLLVCHEYDKTRKVLLMSGLPEEYLSWLGLKSLELYQRPPEEFVKQHRFSER
ncbi:MAG: TIGR03982 family His-Xaa-Ser system protein [gamma proteobacterium symbiont of Clathrolucina costata]